MAPQRSDEFLPVIFRRWREGDLIALFPTEPHDAAGHYCMSYAFVGQHGAADCRGVIWVTRPVSREEYLPLLTELGRIGYREMRVYARSQLWMHHKCQEKARAHPETAES